MKMLVLPALITLAAFAKAEIAVRVSEVTDKRSTGQFFSGLEMKLILSGTELADVKGMRMKVESAKDDTGKDFLEGGSQGVFQDDFEPLKEPFGGSEEDQKPGNFEARISVGNPARTAKKAAITGTIELLSPRSDPSSIVTANAVKDAGKPLAHPALKAAGVTITLSAAKGTEVGYKIADPKGKVAGVEYCAADGKPLETDGRSSMGFAGERTNTMSLKEKLPAGAIAKIYLLTEKSVVRVPLKLDAITLP